MSAALERERAKALRNFREAAIEGNEFAICRDCGRIEFDPYINGEPITCFAESCASEAMTLYRPAPTKADAIRNEADRG